MLDELLNIDSDKPKVLLYLYEKSRFYEILGKPVLQRKELRKILEFTEMKENEYYKKAQQELNK